MTKELKILYPYARTSAIDEIFKLIKEERTWNPSSINVSTLKTLGVASSKESVTIQALKFLGVLDENEATTEIFRNLRESFQLTLERQVRQSYKLIFDQIPLSRVNQDTLVKFFMQDGYIEDTAEYQGALFVYLCKTAGIDLPNASLSFKRARFKKLHK